jgi:hypothetical protein
MALNSFIPHNSAPLLQELHVETCGHVPRNVAMERPHAGIVGIDLEHDEAEWPDYLGVSAGGVGGAGDGAVPGGAVGALGKDKEVVACRLGLATDLVR